MHYFPFHFFLLTLLLLAGCQSTTQKTSTTSLNLTGYPEPIALYNDALKPFYHGIASGDPSTEGVVIWTRITPDEPEKRVNVIWEVAADRAFTNILQRADFQALDINDYVVKINVKRLKPSTTYYYRFFAKETYSPVGATRTLSKDTSSTVRLAIVSGANFAKGDFSVYRQIATMDNLDAVIHLGDYINEAEEESTTARRHYPNTAPIDLHDYRLRHSNYASDPNLQAMRAAHPLIAIWNEHDFATGAYAFGSAVPESDPDRPWAFRQTQARRAFFDWLPIKNNYDYRVYRNFQFGNLVNLLMLDTRIEARDAPVESMNDVALQNENRAVLGLPQAQYVQKILKTSTTKWNILGSANLLSPLKINDLSTLDQWNGYPISQGSLLNTIDQQTTHNTIVLSGDLHTAMASTIDNDSKENIAVELAIPSVNMTSDLGEIVNDLTNENPNLHWAEGTQNGFLLLEISENQTTARFYNTQKEVTQQFTLQPSPSMILER